MGRDDQQGGAPAGYPPPPQGAYYAPPSAAYPPAGAWAGAYPPPGAAYPPPGAYPPPTGAYPPPTGAYPPAPAGYPGAYGVAPPAALPTRPPGAGAPKPPGAPPGGFDRYDVEAQQAANYAAAFAEELVRKQFVRKVFSLVLLQLLVTVGVACVFMFVQPVKDYVRPGGPGQWLFIVVWIAALVILIGLMCSTKLRRTHPWNLVALAAFTLVESALVGMICSYWDASVVLIAFATTCAAVGGLTLVAVFGKFDMTKRGHLLGMASGVFFMVVLVTIIVGFFWVSTWWYLAISCVAALLFSAFLVYDIQMVMGGKMYAIGPDEYVFASVQIYLDVVSIFLMILNIVGIASN
ncbi:lifeguard 1 [Micractinium conductrix]|uniref:Lifeguard 1 n=1 Tax=Micractinium conductrix TaxID=554055 RepID=A0A2P6VMS4_9CHLO|nr:lifeguard 1 [Micractinium conductrix]|eukprot:PSC75383.1 lifeguard 1 [Micractinium conductrix]